MACLRNRALRSIRECSAQDFRSATQRLRTALAADDEARKQDVGESRKARIELRTHVQNMSRSRLDNISPHPARQGIEAALTAEIVDHLTRRLLVSAFERP